MRETNRSILILLPVLCSVLSACTSETQVNPTATTSTSTQSAPSSSQALDPKIVTWLSVCRSNGQEPNVEGLLPQCTATESIRSSVKAKYGDLKAASFCKYFASPEFAALEGAVLSRTVPVTVVSDLDQAVAKTFPPNSIVVYADVADPYRYSYDDVGLDGKAGKAAGGSDHIQHPN